MSPTADKELNKAALVIAKLLIRTREGKIQWTAAGGLLAGRVRAEPQRYTTKLDDGIEAVLVSDSKQLRFELSDASLKSTSAGADPYLDAVTSLLGQDPSKILSISLPHSYGVDERLSPESIIYGDLDELVTLARNPKSVSDDLRLKKAMTYLDRLAG
jgi:hypothetical protein